MHKARKELAITLRDSDLLIELLDARAPAASANPLLAGMAGSLPRLRILNKCDLADPQATAAWLRYLKSLPGSDCLANGLEDKLDAADILASARRLLGSRQVSETRTRQLLISGIPNVGKSTLLNQIAARRLAKTGNEPALTRHQQRIKLDEHWYLVDTPGLLWPKLADQDAAHRLGCIGAIRNTAVAPEDLGWFLAEVLLTDFYPRIQQRYGLAERPRDATELLAQIGRLRGCLGRKGEIDLARTAELLLGEFRSGKIGRLTLEQAPVSGSSQIID